MSLAGHHIVLTAGPTLEAIDPVRFLSNRSSGKQGYAIAGALAGLGAQVTLISGPTALAAPPAVRRIDVESARDMLQAVEAALPARASLTLVENPDILKTVARRETGRPGLVIGFAAETHDVLEQARAKRLRKGCDWIVANDVSGDVMGGEENAAHLITPDGEITWKRAGKSVIANQLASAIAEALAGTPGR